MPSSDANATVKVGEFCSDATKRSRMAAMQSMLILGWKPNADEQSRWKIDLSTNSVVSSKKIGDLSIITDRYYNSGDHHRKVQEIMSDISMSVLAREVSFRDANAERLGEVKDWALSDGNELLPRDIFDKESCKDTGKIIMTLKDLIHEQISGVRTRCKASNPRATDAQIDNLTATLILQATASSWEEF